MLAYETADRLIGRTDLPAHVFDTLVDAFELGTHLVEQHTRLTIQIWVSGDVSHRIVDFAPALVGDDDLERVFETASAVGTVGLTLGITPQLGVLSQLILIVLMYLGRVGGLTLIYAAVSNKNQSGAKLPLEKITVG